MTQLKPQARACGARNKTRRSGHNPAPYARHASGPLHTERRSMSSTLVGGLQIAGGKS
jgi:hypothetical protein